MCKLFDNKRSLFPCFIGKSKHSALDFLFASLVINMSESTSHYHCVSLCKSGSCQSSSASQCQLATLVCKSVCQSVSQSTNLLVSLSNARDFRLSALLFSCNESIDNEMSS